MKREVKFTFPPPAPRDPTVGRNTNPADAQEAIFTERDDGSWDVDLSGVETLTREDFRKLGGEIVRMANPL